MTSVERRVRRVPRAFAEAVLRVRLCAPLAKQPIHVRRVAERLERAGLVAIDGYQRFVRLTRDGAELVAELKGRLT